MAKMSYALFMLFIVLLVLGIFISANIPYILSFYGISSTLYGYALSLIVIVGFGYALIKILNASIISYGKYKKRMDEKAIAKVVSIIGYSIIFLAVLSISKVDLTGLFIGAGFLGIVIGLASQSTIGNLFAGITMMAAKPFAIGDRITFSTWQYGMMPPSYTHHALLPGYSGTIQDIGIMYTRMELDDGEEVYIPNGIMNQAAIINYTVSNKINIKVRAEVATNVDFGDFNRRFMSAIKADRELYTSVKDNINITITDVNVAYYGVLVNAKVPIADESKIISKISHIALYIATSNAPGKANKRKR